jgi:hypothetical protein
MKYQYPNCDRGAKELHKLECGCTSQPMEMLDPDDQTKEKEKESKEIVDYVLKQVKNKFQVIISLIISHQYDMSNVTTPRKLTDGYSSCRRELC